MSKRQNDLPPTALALLMEYGANWLPVVQVQAAGFEAMDAGFTGFIHFPSELTPEQVADFRARWRACFAAAEAAEESPVPQTGAPVVPPQEERQERPMPRDLSTPLAALSVALDVISGYQYDIRNSRDSIGVDLERRGFCGGAFYRNATLQLQQALLRFQQEADAAAEEAPGTAPRTVIEPPPEGTVARAAWDSGQRLWAALRLYITRPSDLDYNWHKEWPALPSALRGQLAYAADDVPAPEPAALPQPVVEPANPYPFRDGSEHFLARTQLTNALTEVRRLEQLIARLDNPLLLGYAGVAVTTLEHLGRALEQRPNPYPLDEGIIAKGEQP